MNLKSVTDEQLLSQTQKAVDVERASTADVIRHLQEINNRKLYLACGYASLFMMLRKKFKYCEPSAQLRINAVRLLNDVPEVEAKLESGEISLTVAASIQTFLYQEKRRENEYSQAAKIELVNVCTAKSANKAQREFAKRNPEMEKRESIKFTSEDRLRVSHSISLQLEEKLKRIKLLWSHVDTNMSRETMLDRMAEITLNQIDPLRKAARAEKIKIKSEKVETDPTTLRVTEVAKTDRYISAEASRQVNARNNDQGCEFVDHATGEICGSKFQIQRDHVKPHSHGGSNDAENLRIYCAAHNRWAWETRKRPSKNNRSYVREHVSRYAG